MILIKLHPNLFDGNGQFLPGTPFEGVDPGRAVLHIATGKPAEGFVNTISTGVSKGENSSKSYLRDHKNSLNIGRTGVNVTDVTFEELMNQEDMYHGFGIQILEYAAQNLIEVSQNGTPLTVSAMKAFTA